MEDSAEPVAEWAVRYELRPLTDAEIAAADPDDDCCAISKRELLPEERSYGLIEATAGLVGFVAPEVANHHPLTMRITWALDACDHLDQEEALRKAGKPNEAEHYRVAARILMQWAMGRIKVKH